MCVANWINTICLTTVLKAFHDPGLIISPILFLAVQSGLMCTIPLLKLKDLLFPESSCEPCSLIVSCIITPARNALHPLSFWKTIHPLQLSLGSLPLSNFPLSLPIPPRQLRNTLLGSPGTL